MAQRQRIRTVAAAAGAALLFSACGGGDTVVTELDASGRLAPRRLPALQLDAERAASVVSEVSGLAWRHPVTAVSLHREGIRGHLEQRHLQRLRVPGPAELSAEQAEEIDFLTHGLLGFFVPEEPAFLFVASDVTPEEQGVVLRHELMHALQQQNFDTLALHATAAAQGGDASLALRAVFEGQATAVQHGRASPATVLPHNPLPRGDGTLGHVGGYAVARKVGAVHAPAQVGRKLAHDDAHAALHDGPLLGFADGDAGLRLAMPFAWAMRRFPYLVGANFIGTLAAQTSLARAVHDTLARPPRSTREVLHPEVYRRGELPPQLTLTALEAAWQPATPFRSTVGEYVTALMLGGTDAAFDVAEGWRADAVLAEAATGNGYWASLWADEAAAANFLARLAVLDGERDRTSDPDVQRLGDAEADSDDAASLTYLRCGRAVVVARGVDVAPDALAAAAARDFAAFRQGEPR